MERNSLMRRRLVVLAICVLAQGCHCVHPPGTPGQGSRGKDDRAVESSGGSPPNCSSGCVQVEELSAVNYIDVGSFDISLLCTVSSSRVYCNMVATNPTSRPSVVESNITSTVLETSSSRAFATNNVGLNDSSLPASEQRTATNASELSSRFSLMKKKQKQEKEKESERYREMEWREEGGRLPWQQNNSELNDSSLPAPEQCTAAKRRRRQNNVELNDSSLSAPEQCTAANASVLASRVFLTEKTQGEEINKEEQESEKQEKEGESKIDGEMEVQGADGRLLQQGGASTGSKWQCEHYQRCCTVWFPCCKQFYACHRCHNSLKICKNKAESSHATYLKCSNCKSEQEINENSAVCSGCRVKMADYFCSLCKSFKSTYRNPYHCDLCGICRIRKDKMYHCEVCNVCMKKRLKNKHTCRPDSGHDHCPICQEDVFRSCHAFVCGHKAHGKCAVDMVKCGMTICPICRKPLRLHPSE